MKYIILEEYSKTITYIMVVIVLLALLFFTVKLVQANIKQADFVKSEVNGKLVSVKSHGHDYAGLKLVRVPNGDTIEIRLPIDEFSRENQLRPGDSISKSTDSRVMFFFKKGIDGKYSDAIEFQIPR